MNQLFLKDSPQKTRRVLRVEAGLSCCGNSYGYAAVRRLGPGGVPVTAGERQINRRPRSSEGSSRSSRRGIRELQFPGGSMPKATAVPAGSSGAIRRSAGIGGSGPAS
jgi:hypothetical protein